MKIDCSEISPQSIVPNSAGASEGNPMRITFKQVLSFISQYYVQERPPSSSHEFNGFRDYMSKMEVTIANLAFGSLLITLNISTLPILERLWEDYTSGHLGEVVQTSLATDEILNVLGLTELKLRTTISAEDYRTCKQTLQKMADTGKFLPIDL